MLPNLGPGEMLVVMMVAVLLFGKRLPEVGRSLGKGIVEFKKGLRGISDELDISGPPARKPEPYHSYDSYATSTSEPPPAVPKFEPPTGAPVPQADAGAPSYQD
jgi:sec-independent protein translocase protein TatA